VAEHIEGGIQRWHEISHGLSSDQLLEVLLNELSGPSTGLSLTTAEYLTCQGDSENVPAFLRYNGSVRNKKLTKRDTLILINDIWDERRKSKLKCCFTDFLNQ
ncbi:Translin-associated factor X-interacting protein 1, partial [Armadillidium vulgare]